MNAWAVIDRDGSLFTSKNATEDHGLFGYIAESEVAARAHARPDEQVVRVVIEILEER